MPILPAEPDLFPEDRWPGETDAPGRWWCLHTKPRQEKATARDLRVWKISYYLPQVVHEDRTPKGRKIRSILPLFPGYVFLRGGETERLTALRGNRLVSVLDVSDQVGFDLDLRQIHRVLGSGLAVIPEPSVAIGSKFRVVNGPLAGLVGSVVRRGKLDRFVAVVRFLGSGATVDLLDWQVEPI